jgi:hypothetical protein
LDALDLSPDSGALGVALLAEKTGSLSYGPSKPTEKRDLATSRLRE